MNTSRYVVLNLVFFKSMLLFLNVFIVHIYKAILKYFQSTGSPGRVNFGGAKSPSPQSHLSVRYIFIDVCFPLLRVTEGSSAGRSLLSSSFTCAHSLVLVHSFEVFCTLFTPPSAPNICAHSRNVTMFHLLENEQP